MENNFLLTREQIEEISCKYNLDFYILKDLTNLAGLKDFDRGILVDLNWRFVEYRITFEDLCEIEELLGVLKVIACKYPKKRIFLDHDRWVEFVKEINMECTQEIDEKSIR